MKVHNLKHTIEVEPTTPQKLLINQIEKPNSSKTKSIRNKTGFSKYIYNVQKNLFKPNNSIDTKNQILNKRNFQSNNIDEHDFTFEKNQDNKEEFDSDEYISSTNLDVETNTYIDTEKNSEYEKKDKNIKVKLNSNEKIKKIIKNKINNSNYVNAKFRDFFKNLKKSTIKNPKKNVNPNISDNKPTIYKKLDANIINSNNNSINNQKLKKNQLKNYYSTKILKSKKKIENDKANLTNHIINNNTNIITNEKKCKKTSSKNGIYSGHVTDTKKSNKNGTSYNSNTNTNTNVNTKSNTKSNTNLNLNKDNLCENMYDKNKNYSFINNINPQNSINNLNNFNNNQIIFSPSKVINVSIDERNKTPIEINRNRPIISPNLEWINILSDKNNNKKMLYVIPKNNLKNKNIIPNSNRNTTYMRNNSNNLIYINKKNNIISLNKIRINQLHSNKTAKNINNNKIQIRKYFSFVSKNKKNVHTFHYNYNNNMLTLDDQRKINSSFSPKSQRNIFNKNNYNLNSVDTLKTINNRVILKKEILHNKVMPKFNPNINILNTIDNNPSLSNISNLNNNMKLILNNKHAYYQRSLNQNIFDNILNITSEKKNSLYKSPLQKSDIILTKNNSKAKYKHNHSLSIYYNNNSNTNNTINNNSCNYSKIVKNNNIFSYRKGGNGIKIPIDFLNNSNKLNLGKKVKDNNNENIVYNSINFNTGLAENNTIMLNNNCNCSNNYIASDSIKRKINYKQQIVPLNSTNSRKIKKFIPIDRTSPNITNKKLINKRNNNLACDNFNTISNAYKSISNKDYIYSMNYKDKKLKK